MYDIKELYQAHTLEEAIEQLKAHPESRIIAGGSDILIAIRDGREAAVSLLSIHGIASLRDIRIEEDGCLRIGPLASFTELIRSEAVQRCLPVLAEAVATVGGPQLRNIATIGGNICNGVTSADSAATLMAYDSLVEVQGPEGQRRIPIQKFYIKAGVVDLHPAEVMTGLLIPKESYANYHGYYYKYAMRQAMDIATCTCSVNVKLNPEKNTLEDVRIAFGVAAPVPLRAPSAEIATKGKAISRDLADRFAAAAMQDVNPRTSWRATKEFRLHIMEEMAKRCFIEAVRRAGGEI